MKCPKCGSVNNTPIKLKDGRSGAQCNDCGCKMAVKKKVELESPAVVQSEPVSASSSVMNSIEEKSKESFVKRLKTWIKNPISIASTSINGVLLIICIVLVIISVSNIKSNDTEIQSYALANGYILADFDKFNSPAEENGLGNTKIYFSGKVKELTKVGTYNVALIEENENPENTWGIMFFDNDIYEKFAKGKNVVVFGYYQGYSDKYNAPFVFYYNGFIDGKWYEYDDTLGIFNALSNENSSNLVVDGEFVADKDEMVDAINTIDGVVYSPLKFEGDETDFYVGQITDDVKCTIVCDTNGQAIKAIQVETNADGAYDAGNFFVNLMKLFDSENYEKNSERLIEKLDLENIKQGDVNNCVISDMFYSCDYSKENKLILSVLPA